MKKTFRLEGLCCANCAAKIEKAVQALPGVSAASLNLMTTKLTIESELDDMTGIVESAAAIVRRIEPDVAMKKA
ncbi:MAG: cation transporter [Acutalibacteraceae bacterium]|jgi:copper chaperone CopZ